jgi:hypothetical protein
MEITQYIIEKDITAYIIEASSFPEGVDLAHNTLHSLFLDKKNWQFYGISYMRENGTICYMAGASSRIENVENTHHLATFTIKKGNYNSVLLPNFMEDESRIFPTFQHLLKDPQLDPQGYCLEIFENKGQDMRCLVKLSEYRIINKEY